MKNFTFLFLNLFVTNLLGIIMVFLGIKSVKLFT
jgi:hypothetical protein